MRSNAGGTSNWYRRLIAVSLAASVVVGAALPASARVTKQDLVAAQTRLHALYRRLDGLVEQYDQATVLLHRTEVGLGSARADLARAQATADAARADLDARARAAYETGGSWLGALLGTTSLADLSTGAEDLQALAQQDEAVAVAAQVSGEQAREAATRLRAIVSRRQALLSTLAVKKRQIRSDIGQAAALVTQIKGSLAKQAAAARAAAAAARRRAAAAAAAAAARTNPPPAPPPSPGPGSGGPPPPSARGAAIAVAAARSVLGVPYVYAGASPQSGFDCSGLTMWSWAHAGISLPHSAAMQYAALPHVSSSQLQPGDLVFFYHPIEHVGIYIGGGMMIDANHTGGSVGIRTVYWAVYAGAARP